MTGRRRETDDGEAGASRGRGRRNVSEGKAMRVANAG